MHSRYSTAYRYDRLLYGQRARLQLVRPGAIIVITRFELDAVYCLSGSPGTCRVLMGAPTYPGGYQQSDWQWFNGNEENGERGIQAFDTQQLSNQSMGKAN